MRRIETMLAAAIAAALLMPAAAAAKPSVGAHEAKVHRKATAKPRWRGYGFLPGYRQPPNLSDWRDRSVLYGAGRYQRPELRFFTWDGRVQYGWGPPGFYHGRWNGGSFGPCWTQTPIGK